MEYSTAMKGNFTFGIQTWMRLIIYFRLLRKINCELNLIKVKHFELCIKSRIIIRYTLVM